MQLTPPYGYGEFVPLLRHHRILIPQAAAPDFCRHLNALAISISEFAPAARDDPIVPASLDNGRSFAPVLPAGR